MQRYAQNAYQSLRDTARITGDSRYGVGDFTIWYFRPSERILMKGNSYIRTHHPERLPRPWNLERTHIRVGNVNEDNKDEILTMMQARLWNPRGEADAFVERLGLDHVSMTAGDVIQRGDECFMVDSLGWFEDLWLMTIDEAYANGYRKLRKLSWEPYAHIELITFEGERAEWAKFHEKVQTRNGTDPEVVPITPPHDFGYPVWVPWRGA
jgi:hypothetical protein